MTLDQHDVPFKTEAARAGDAARHIQNGIEVGGFRLDANAPETGEHLPALGFGRGDMAEAVDSNAPSGVSPFGSLIQEFTAASLLEPLEERLNHTRGCGALDPPWLAGEERAAVALQKHFGKGDRLILGQLNGFRAEEDAGDEASQVAARGQQTRLIKIIHIEIRETVLTFERAKVFEMKVTAAPGERRCPNRGVRWNAFVEEVAATAKESKGIFSHPFVPLQ